MVDDGSTDETSEMLGQVEGLIQIRNDVNLDVTDKSPEW